MSNRFLTVVPERVESLRLGENEVHYREMGEGPVLLCSEMPLNPLGRYHLLQQRLAEKYRVIVLDFRPAVGASPIHPPARNLLDFLSTRSFEAMDALGIEHCSLIGSFMYGAVAMNMALLAPERVQKLVLLGPLGLVRFPQTLQLRFVTTVFRLPLVPLLLRSRRYRRFLALADLALLGPSRFRQIFYDPDNAPISLSDLYEQNKIPENKAAALTLMWAIRTTDYSELVPRIPEISCPTLIIRGSEDVWIPAHFDEKLQRLIGGSKLVEIPFSRHVPEVEQPDLTSAEITRFLENK